MARMVVDGYDALFAGLEDMISSLPELRDAILEAEADAAEPIIRQGVLVAKLKRTGTLHRSIKRKRTTGRGIPVIRIGPSGTHHLYIPRNGGNGVGTSGYVGYIHEYGEPSRGIRGRKWLSNAVALAKVPAYDAAETVYDEYMKNHNL